MPAPTGGIRVFQLLSKLYPRDFQNQYGAEMTRDFRENLEREGSSFGFWIRVIWDVISSATLEQFQGGFMLQKTAAVSAVLIASITLVRTFIALGNPQLLVASLLETILLILGLVALFFGVLSRSKTERTLGWWLIIGAIVLCTAVTVSLIPFSGQIKGFDVLSKFSNLIIFGSLALSTVAKTNGRVSVRPTFWGLAVLTCAGIVQILSPPIMVNPETSKFIGGVESWLTYGSIVFSLGFLLLAAALWNSNIKPQPRALV